MINVAFAFAPQWSKVGMKIPRIRHWTVGLHTSTEVDSKPARCLSGDDSSMNIERIAFGTKGVCQPLSPLPSRFPYLGLISASTPDLMIADTMCSEAWTIAAHQSGSGTNLLHLTTSQSQHWWRCRVYRAGWASAWLLLPELNLQTLRNNCLHSQLHNHWASRSKVPRVGRGWE